MKRYLFWVLIFSLLFSGISYGANLVPDQGALIELDTTNFDGTLSGADIDTQKALDTLDDATKTIVGATIDNSVIGGTTPAAGSFTTLEASGAVTIDDGTTDSPAIIQKDGTDETYSCIKKDAGYVECTSTAGDGMKILVGNLVVGDACTAITIDGEDFCVDGDAGIDGDLTVVGAITGVSIATGSSATPEISLDITTGIDWDIRLIPNGLGLEIASGSGAVGTDVALKLYPNQDVSPTPSKGVTTGVTLQAYVVSLLDDAEADSCDVTGDSGAIDCIILPIPTTSGRLIVRAGSTVYGVYLVSNVGVATPVTEVSTAYVAAIADCANAVICLFDDATTANALGIINQLGATTTIIVEHWFD